MRILKIIGTLIVLVLVTASQANAISRYNSLSFTCAKIRQVISSEGAVILRYPGKFNPGIVLHDRFVNNVRWCQMDEYTAIKSVPTSDNRSCRLRYCKIIDFDNNGPVRN